MNAQVEAEALRLGTPVFLNRFEVLRTERISRQWELWENQLEVVPSHH